MSEKGIYYSFKEHPQPEYKFLVTKLDEDYNPIDTYNMTKMYKCDCPAYKRECKHVKMAKELKELNPNAVSGVYNTETGEFQNVIADPKI